MHSKKLNSCRWCRVSKSTRLFKDLAKRTYSTLTAREVSFTYPKAKRTMLQAFIKEEKRAKRLCIMQTILQTISISILSNKTLILLIEKNKSSEIIMWVLQWQHSLCFSSQMGSRGTSAAVSLSTRATPFQWCLVGSLSRATQVQALWVTTNRLKDLNHSVKFSSKREHQVQVREQVIVSS